MSSYWWVEDISDTAKASCKKSSELRSVTIGSDAIQINVPTIINTSKIAVGEALVVLNTSVDEGDAVTGEPDPNEATREKGSGTSAYQRQAGEGKSKSRCKGKGKKSK